MRRFFSLCIFSSLFPFPLLPLSLSQTVCFISIAFSCSEPSSPSSTKRSEVSSPALQNPTGINNPYRRLFSSSLTLLLLLAPEAMSAWKDRDTDPRIEGIASSLRVISNFPKPGFMFKDITTLLLNPKAFKNTVDLFVERYAGRGITVVAGVEARGFIFGPPIALAIGAKFVPLRKPKKLPGAVISEKYDLEYGTDCLEMHIGAVEAGECALVVDDLVATGGTLCAAINLLERSGAEVVECACVVEVLHLKGRRKLNGKPLYVLVESD